MTEKKNELMINKEAQKKLFEKGKKDGTVTLIDIMEAFQDNDMDKGVAENLYETLGNLGIEVVDDKEIKADIDLTKPDDLDLQAIDEEEDKEILDESGLGIAMGNSIEELKGYADYVTDNIADDGVFNALAKFGFINT